MAETSIPATDIADLRDAAERALDVSDFEVVRTVAQREALRLRGRLLLDPESAYRAVAPRFRELGYTAILDGEPEAAQLTALPGVIEPTPSRLWLALLLFALTVLSTIFIGGANGTHGLRLPDGVAAALGGGPLFIDLGLGLAYSAALLGILLSHELGHYFVARRLSVRVSFPFFIPLPIGILGTMGAVIQIKEPPPDRRALLRIGVAGPLAGLVVAIPVLLLGLSLSEVGPPPSSGGYFVEGNSLLYALIKIAVFGRFLPDGTQDVLLHPVAMAGWAGLLVTGLNLLPAGQLDGGHILYALFGRRASRYASMVVAGLLVALGFLWSGWWLWAVLVALFGQQPAPVLNEITPLDRRGRVLAILGIVAFVLVFVPTPITIVQ